MATIYLVRHGQASFGKENYDKLSQKGLKQGLVLGRWLADKLEPVAVFGGELVRHRETAEAIAAGFGSKFPKMQVVPGFNEFDHRAVINRYRPQWQDRAIMARDLGAHSKPARAFQEAFVTAVRRWASGEYDHEYNEIWPDFKARVLRAFNEIIKLADGNDVLVATSGGPIAVICQQLLGMSDERALGLNEIIANTSVTRVLYSGTRQSLSVFNNYSHLEAEDSALVTFR
jgi:broad specificity phosphatase PhoE